MRQVCRRPEQEVATTRGQGRAQQVPRLPLRGARGRAQEAVSRIHLRNIQGLSKRRAQVA